MSRCLGRERGIDDGVTGHLGWYRALDGSPGAPLHVDLDSPHAGLVVGKRGFGKSHTLGVLAEELARGRGTAPVILDPMGEFATLTRPSSGAPVPASVVANPTVDPATLDGRAWCALVGLDPEGAAGSLLWRGARTADTIDEMCRFVEMADAADSARRTATNHLRLAADWGVFDADGLTAEQLSGGEATVLDLAGIDRAPMNAVVRAVADALYRARTTGAIDRLPWLLIDEAHTFFDGVAAPALRTLLTRGRSPGVSIVLATQRPSSVPPVALSQSDLLLSHRLTAAADVEALAAAEPTYATESVVERLPTEPGAVLVVDDVTESLHAARVRERATPHGGGSPRASAVDVED